MKILIVVFLSNLKLESLKLGKPVLIETIGFLEIPKPP